MAKNTFKKYLSTRDENELFVTLADTIASMKNATEIAQLLRDLLTPSESTTLARRIQIAELLLAAHTYADIRKFTKASPVTIAKIQSWLSNYGEGFRKASQRRAKSKRLKPISSDWQKFERKYPMYFWPQILLEELVKHAGVRSKKRLLSLAATLQNKGQLAPEFSHLISLQ